DDSVLRNRQPSVHPDEIFPHWIFLTEKVTSHRLVDHCCSRRGLAGYLSDSRLFFLWAKIAPLQKRYAHRLEKPRSHPEHLERSVCARWRSVAGHFDTAAAGSPAEIEQETIRDAGRPHARQCLEPRQQLFVQARQLCRA